MQALIALATIPIGLVVLGLYVDGITRWMRLYQRGFFATMAAAWLLVALLQWRIAGTLTVQVVPNGLLGLLYGLMAVVAPRGEQPANGPEIE